MTMNNQHPDFENYDIPEHLHFQLLSTADGYISGGVTVASGQPREVREEIYRWYMDKAERYGGPYPHGDIL
jgi:hypothetical protein